MVQRGTANFTVTVSSTGAILVPVRSSKIRRTDIVITNNTGEALTITKNYGDQKLTAGVGLVIQNTMNFVETTDAGNKCWQGSYQAITVGAGGTVNVQETLEVD